jgi:hypothetical protein
VRLLKAMSIARSKAGCGSWPFHSRRGASARMAMAAPAQVIAPPCCIPGSHATVAFPAALPTPPISGGRGLSSKRPTSTSLGSLLFFSGRNIEDDVASENVRSWWKETCRR